MQPAAYRYSAASNADDQAASDDSSVTAWTTRSPVAGSASRTPTQVRPGEYRTDHSASRTTRTPNALKAARPMPDEFIAGYATTPMSWTANRIAEGFLRT